MTADKDDTYDDLDAYDPDLDLITGEDDFAPASDLVKTGTKPRSARQEIEHRREMSWLRDQTEDWDYWDDFLQVH